MGFKLRIWGLSLLIAAAGCSANEQEAPASKQNDSFWKTASQERLAPVAERLAALETEITAPKYGNLDRLLIIHRNEVIADIKRDVDYEAITANENIRSHQFNYQDPSWHPFYRGTELHTLQSITKSVTSTAVGIAVTRGEFGDVAEMKVVDILGDAFEMPHRDERLEALTVHHLLTMRTGLPPENVEAADDPNETGFPLEESPDWVQFVLNDPMQATPDTAFEYHNGATQILGTILQIITGVTLEDYAQEHLFKPLGIDAHYWKKTPAGRTDALGGLYLEAEDLAKVCKLMGEDGVWNGERLLSSDWIKAATASYSDDLPEDARHGGEETGYGYQWWKPLGFSETAFEGRGYGGNYLLCSPDDDLIVVQQRWNPSGLPVFSGAENPYPVIKQRLRSEILPLL
ncbi:MAG: serine hydrolase [Pseudomonadota bacterium]